MVISAGPVEAPWRRGARVVRSGAYGGPSHPLPPFWGERLRASEASPEEAGALPPALRSTLAGVKIYTIAQNKMLARGLIQRRYRMVNDVLRSTGVVKGTLNPSKTLNFSYLP